MKIAEIRAKFPQYKDVSDGELVRALHKKHYSDIPYADFLKKIDFSEKVNPTDGMSWIDKFLAGTGKAVSDVGLGVRQITGNASQEEVDAVKERDKPLMDTGAGMVGNVAGNVAMAVTPGLGVAGTGSALGLHGVRAVGRRVLASPATLGGAATQGALGATQAAVQPVATGESRTGNALIGAAGGAAVPVAGMTIKGVNAATEPLYEAGRNRILARALREATGDNTDTVIQNLKTATPLIPGSNPTAAEVGQSGGLAALQRAAAAVDPEAYATRAAQQNEARVAALQQVSGNGRRGVMEAIRDEGADEMYAAARRLGVNQEMAKALKPQIDNLMQRMPSGVLERAKELARLNGEALDGAGSVNGLHWMKLAVDDMLSAGKQTGIGTQTERALVQFKNDLLSVVDELSPVYGQARQSFAEMSQLPNRMAVGEEIVSRAVNPLTGQVQPQALARALSDDTAVRATGFRGATLANTVEPEKRALLDALKQDVARSVQARDLGRGAGSDTVQKLAMTNLMQQSGIPVGVLHVPGVGRLGNWAYSVADDKMKASLAQALLDPKQTASIMERGAPNHAARRLALILRSGATPIGVGAAPALLDAPQ